MQQKNLFESLRKDLEWIENRDKSLKFEFQNSHILVIGASGFIGSWLSSYFYFLKTTHQISLELTLMRRRNQEHEIIELNDSNYCNWIVGDSSEIDFNKANFTHVYFCSTPSQPKTGMEDQELVYNSTVYGIKNILEELGKQCNKPKFFNFSSGAVYKLNPDLQPPFSEIDLILVENLGNWPASYAKAKMISENLVSEFSDKGSINGFNFRIFALSGPLLPLDSHFAIGNFTQNAFLGRPIEISGNPYTLRSYVYIAELIYWVMHISNMEKSLTINMSGFESISMLEMAQEISGLVDNHEIKVVNEEAIKSEYFGDMSYFNLLTNLNQQIDFKSQVKLHLDWLKETNVL